MNERPRDYAFEALAEVTAADPAVARGKLNAALRDIRAQEPELASVDQSYLLGAEIHERAKMYRSVFANAALTPNALAQHWQRVKAEVHKAPRVPAFVPEREPSSRERNLEEARKLMEKMGWK
jgi:hypothetical protein